MKKMFCLFCLQPGRTREHALPKWLAELLPGIGPFAVTVETDAPGISARRWQSISLDLVAKKFCSKCNNVWLRDLEELVRQFLGPMVEGQPFVLSKEHQELLAAWTYKTALTCTLVTIGPRKYFKAADYHEFRQHRRPAAGTRIWLAAYDAILWNARFRERMLNLTQPSTSESQTDMR